MSFVRKSAVLAAGQMIGIFLTFAMGILYARVLGAEGIGQWRLFDTVKLIAGSVAVTGVGPASIYFINNLKQSIPRVATINLYFAMVSGILTFAVVLCLVLCAKSYFGKVPLYVAIPYALSVGTIPAFSVLYQIMFAEMATLKLIVSQLASTLVAIVVGAVLALLHWMTVPNAILAAAAGTYVSTTAVILYQRKYIDFSIDFDWGLFRQIWVYGLKLASAGILLLVTMELSVILLGYIMPGQFAEVGLYSRAATICGIAAMLPRLIAPLLYSKWSSVGGEALAREVELALRLSALYSLVTVAILLLTGKYIIWLMYGKAFLPAAPALQVLAISSIFFSAYMVANNAIIGSGKGGMMNWILAGTLLVMSTAIWLLVPRMGIMGAAVGTLCGNVFLGGVTLAACRKLFGVRPMHCLVVMPKDIRYFLIAVKHREKDAAAAGPPVTDPISGDCR